MDAKILRVFLDTSALVAGIVSSKGAARQVLRLGQAGVFQLVVSPQVLRELDRNITKKYPRFASASRAQIANIRPELCDEPKASAVRKFHGIIEKDDQAILAAAVEAKVEWLVTWNTRDFMVEKVAKSVDFKIVTPGQLLKAFEEIWMKDRK